MSGEATLYFTVDRGKSFTPLHATDAGAELPQLPVLAVAYDPADASGATFYVGNTAGVFRTSDGGHTFARYGEGLPTVPVTEIFVSKHGGLVRIGTWGRGVWELAY